MPSVQSETGGSQATVDTDDVTLVDPRAPRFGQAITASGLLLGLALQEPLLIAAVAVILNTSLLSGWRYDLYGVLWRSLVLPRIDKPDDKEPAAPHRFAKLMGAVFTGLATVFLVADLVVAGPTVALGLSSPALAGYGLAALVAALAGFAAATDICLGCRMYKQVSFFRRLGVV